MQAEPTKVPLTFQSLIILHMNNKGVVMKILSALSSNPSSHLDNADCAVAQPQRWQENHLGKRGHLAEGCWRLRRLRLLTARAIMKHLVYQTPTEGRREAERESDTATFWIIFLWFSITAKNTTEKFIWLKPLHNKITVTGGPVY